MNKKDFSVFTELSRSYFAKIQSGLFEPEAIIQPTHFVLYTCPWCWNPPEIIRNDGLIPGPDISIACTEPSCPVQPKLKNSYYSAREAAEAWNRYVYLIDEKIAQLRRPRLGWMQDDGWGE